ncbi:MAG: hypothetical protein GY769_23325, partial [bacterium]|nr:hypothetical protein [bacterium]
MAESKVQLGTFEELIDITQDAMRPVAERLREIILGIHPEACEVVRLGDRAATYGVGPKKAKELVAAGITSIEELQKQPELLNDKQKIGLKYY